MERRLRFFSSGSLVVINNYSKDLKTKQIATMMLLRPNKGLHGVARWDCLDSSQLGVFVTGVLLGDEGIHCFPKQLYLSSSWPCTVLGWK